MIFPSWVVVADRASRPPHHSFVVDCAPCTTLFDVAVYAASTEPIVEQNRILDGCCCCCCCLDTYDGVPRSLELVDFSEAVVVVYVRWRYFWNDGARFFPISIRASKPLAMIALRRAW